MKYDCTAGRILAEFDKDRLVPLLREVVAQLDGVEGQQGWIASLRFGVAGALADLGDIDNAVPVFRRLVAQNPQHAWAWIGLVDALHASGDAAAAVEAGRDALGHLPGNRVLWNRTARALRDHEGPGAAAAFFVPTLDAEASPRDLDFAISLFREAGQAAQAAQICQRLLGADPDAPIAHMALIEAALADRDAEAARHAARAALARSPEHPELRLRIAQGLFAAGEAASALGVLDALPPGSSFASEARTLRERCEACLGDGGADAAMLAPSRRGPADPDVALALGDVDLGATIPQGAALAPDLPWYLALRLVERALRSPSVEAAGEVAAAFDSADWSATDRQAFEIEQRLLRLGPSFALDWIRANPVAGREREGAERVGRVLLDGGTGPLAARYLRACCRRWPEDRAIGQLAAIAWDACGMEVSGCVPQASDGPSIQSLARDGATSPRVGRVEACLLTGNLKQAEAELAELRIEDGPLEEALIRRPRATRIGSLLNEARILAAVDVDWTAGDVERLAPLAEGYFLPARRIVAALASAPTGGHISPPVTEAVHLVWPSSATPSAEAERLFEAWRAATRRAVTVHLVQDGAAWLAEAGGEAAVRAFRLTQDEAQKADMLMLALSVVKGGAIIMADQGPARAVDALLDAATAPLLFRDRDGSVSLDALMMPAGHPLARRALGAMVTSCLVWDNDHRWFKTGPGLMTRAMATHLAHLDGGTATVGLRSIEVLRRHMYRHWTVVPNPTRDVPDAADALLARAMAHSVDGADAAGCHASG